MPTPSRSLILGTAFGYQVGHIWTFVESLRRFYDGDVMMLVPKVIQLKLLEYFASRRISPVLFECAQWMIPNVQFSRFVRYEEILRSLPHHYERILLTDVADVIFQGHPFAGAPEGELLLFLESADRTIGSCKVNSEWIRDLYGQEMVTRLASMPISCSGTTIGSHAAVLEYLDRLTGQVGMEQFIPLRAKRGHDQGIHNVLLHTGLLPKAQAIPNGRHIFTVGKTPDWEISMDGNRICVAATGQCPPIIHQFTYKPLLKSAVLAEYGQTAEAKRWLYD